jgi:hypothetical protein
MYSWASKSRVILICGHSHRAIFAAKSYGDRLRDEIAQLEAGIAVDPANTQLVAKNKASIEQHRHELRQEERRKERDIDPAEPRGKPLPCYFNVGCGLYTDGITVLEVADGEVRLIKWHKDTRRHPPFDIYGKGSLNAFVKAIAG